MSEMTPWMRILISVFLVSVKRQSPSAARSSRRRAAVTVSVAVASVNSATTPAESDLDIFGSRIANSPMARRPLSGGTVTSVLAGEVHNRGSAGAGRRSR